MRFAAFEKSAAHSGVTVSCKPRSAPLSTKPVSKKGAAIARQRIYATAWGRTSAAPFPASRTHAFGATNRSTAAMSVPIIAATRVDSTTILDTSPLLFSPAAAETSGVVEAARKLKRPKTPRRSTFASPTPLRDSTPRRPTKAMSTADMSGSTISVPSAGRAILAISLSLVRSNLTIPCTKRPSLHVGGVLRGVGFESLGRLPEMKPAILASYN
mmetsp:Transcript_5630/g.16754  ORF Transcript_5630/g.16754 Transcript_5630/m.16754 type:complete len:214 (-) Transcript_5630:49-690(-)